VRESQQQLDSIGGGPINFARARVDWCGDTCPVYPGKRYQDWDVADPAGQSIEVVRAIRDDIAGRVRALLGTFTPAAPA
jgi:protein-tyrosine-phosphatase